MNNFFNMQIFVIFFFFANISLLWTMVMKKEKENTRGKRMNYDE